MEFNHKLQELRKRSGLTQEQLSEKLYISRTAVSKWESGRGFPNIEALKNISKVFNVPIDELLSGEELLNAAESDNRIELNKVYSFIFGIFDLLEIAFIFLPLYGQKTDDYIRSVNLFNYTEVSNIKIGYFIALITLGLFGLVEIIVHFFDDEKTHRICRLCSLALHSITILLFILTREPYVTFFLFILLVSKVVLLIGKPQSK